MMITKSSDKVKIGQGQRKPPTQEKGVNSIYDLEVIFVSLNQSADRAPEDSEDDPCSNSLTPLANA